MWGRLRASFYLMLTRMPPVAARTWFAGRARVFQGRTMDPMAQALGSFAEAVASTRGKPNVKRMRRGYRLSARIFDDPGPKMAVLENKVISVRTADLKIRIFDTQEAQDPRPALIFFHGGGFALGDLDTHHGACTRLANASGLRVVSVAYRLAPEHPFPAALDDAIAVHDWLEEHGAEIGVNAERLAYGGDSAGGGITSALMHELAVAGRPMPRAQALIYPALDPRMCHPVFEEMESAYILSKRMLNWFFHLYIPAETDLNNPRISPALSDRLNMQPPTLVLTCGHDPLRPDAEIFAERLKEAGVAVTYQEVPHQIHGFINFARILPDADRTLAMIGEWLKVIV